MTIDPAEHPSDDLLVAMACNELNIADRRAIEAHLADCPDCRAIWSAVEAVQAEAVQFDPGAIAPPRRRFSGPSRPRVAAGLMAAMLALTVVGIWRPWSSTNAPVPPVRARTQATTPTDLAPEENARVLATGFSWSGVDGASGYVVELLDAAGTTLWTSERLVFFEAPWPSTIEPRAGDYLWRVTAFFSDGREPSASPLVMFEVVTE